MAEPAKPMEWVLDRMIPKVGVSILAADGGFGKSWLSLHLSLCVASGTKFLGQFPVTQGKVLIIDEESSEISIRQRCEKLYAGTPITKRNLDIYISALSGINIDDEDDMDWLLKKVHEIKPSLVIIDALIRVHTKDENSAKDMQGVLRQAKRLAEEGKTSILITHHTSKSYQGRQKTSSRGSTDIRNFVDSLLFGYQKGQQKVIEHDKSRHGMAVEPFGFAIKDENDGVKLEIAEIINTHQRESKWAEAEKLIFSMLKDGKKVSREELLTAGDKNIPRIGRTTMDKNLRRLEKAGTLESSGGDGKYKYYFVKK